MKTVKLPDFVDYPEFFKIKENESIFKDSYGYVLEPYELNGYSLFIGFRDKNFFSRISDFKSNEINLLNNKDIGIKYLLNNLYKISNILYYAKINECLLYFANKSNPTLVDMMVSSTKFCGPGMLRDIFGKSLKIQQTVEICNLNDDNVKKYKGKYFKPSRFKYTIKEKIIKPLYGII
jgi:hypothetical protein